MPKTYNQRVWEGDSATIVEAFAAYERSPSDETLVALATALYSFRHRGRNAEALLRLRTVYREYAERFLASIDIEAARQAERTANRAELISAHLFWFAHRSELEFRERAALRHLVRQLVDASTGLITDRAHHTPYFLILRGAMLQLEIHGTLAGHYLTAVRAKARTVRLIREPEQRARAYRMLGLIYRRSGAWLTGSRWIVRACSVPGIPLPVRLKSAAALLGIKR